MSSPPRGERLQIRAAGWLALLASAAGVFALGDGTPARAGARSLRGASSSASQGLDVLPFPGTPDAAPGTSVDFPAVSPGQIASVKVVGSRSGLHSGRLSAQPDRRGTAFSVARPFAAGERVSVTARLRSAAAGTASGAPGARRLEFSFSVADPGIDQPPRAAATRQVPPPSHGEAAGHTTSRWPGTHSFVTEPGFHVPWISMSGNDTDRTSGYIVLDSEDVGKNAVYMLNGRGELLWYRPTARRGRGRAAFNARFQRYRGHRVITYWRGRLVNGHGAGEDLILNSSYKTVHVVTAGNGYQKQGTDFHEFTLGHQGSEAVAFVAIWSLAKANLTSVGGPASGLVVDPIIQEIDLATDRVIWEWHALGHAPVERTYNRYVSGQPLDYFHLNSIQQLPDGHLLVSSRNTWAIYSIDMRTGKVAWQLGGKHSAFAMTPGTQFEWQHDATLHPGGLMTVFDDAFNGATRESSQSRALEIRLKSRRATLVRALYHEPPALASSGGSVEVLPNHNFFVGWGAGRFFSEYSPSGRQIFSGLLVKRNESYRAYRARWTGHPRWPPAVAVRKTSSANRFNVYASWNGATQVGKWRVLKGPSKSGPFKTIRTVSWSSFETRVPVSTHAAYVKVQALGKSGKPLAGGSSRAVRTGL
ncbi:MAG: arylsulfotransferase family protein [Solirubrobacteraceae bacterium]